LQNHGNGIKITDMEHKYSHHHMVHAHNTGLVIGTIVGSCVITFVIAAVVAGSNPKVIMHPLSFASDITFKSTQSNNAKELGVVGAKSNGYFITIEPATGVAAQSLAN